MTADELQQLADEYSAGESPLPKQKAENVAYHAGARMMLELVLDKVEELKEEVNEGVSKRWLLDTNKLNAIFGKLNGSPKP